MTKAEMKAINRLQCSIRNGGKLDMKPLAFLRLENRILRMSFFGGDHLPTIEESKEAIAGLQQHIKQFKGNEDLIVELNKLFHALRNGTFEKRDTTPVKKQLKKGVLYLAKSESHKKTKIGFTTAPKARIKQLTIGDPGLHFVFVSEPRFTTIDELALHNRWHHKRHQGEWFGLSSAEIEEIKKSLV